MNYINQPDKKLIKQGDTCVIYISEHQKSTLKIEPDNQLQTKFGQIKATDLVGHPYGIRYDCKKGWILPLRLTPELWTQILPHRTQILYQADISMILLQLDIKPGSIVVESGTGSGSLSHAILRACRPHGHLYTYDISEPRVIQARSEFISHGFESNVTVDQRNICEKGYQADLEGKVDACILDLPQTWDAIEHAYKVLKPSGSRLCAFSPCIEQVQQNVARMESLKMRDITTIETLLKPFDVKEQSLRIWDEDVLDKLAKVDEKRFENLKNTYRGLKRVAQDDDELLKTEEEKTDVDMKLDDSNNGDQDMIALNKALEDPKAPFHPRMLPKQTHIYPRQFYESVSHSGFLTFATKRC